MKELLESYVNSGKQVQIKLRGDFVAMQGLGGLGPGLITTTDFPGVYKIVTDAQIGTPAGVRHVKMPFLFRGEDVLWVSEGPEGAGDPVIETPNKGLYVPSA